MSLTAESGQLEGEWRKEVANRRLVMEGKLSAGRPNHKQKPEALCSGSAAYFILQRQLIKDAKTKSAP